MSDPVDLIVKETQLCRRVKLGLQTLHCVTEFVCEVSLLYIFLTTLRSAVLTDERSLCLSLSLFFFLHFSCGSFWTRGHFFKAGHFKGAAVCSRAQCWRNERDGGLGSEAMQPQRRTEM